jgi:hypothetical protein
LADRLHRFVGGGFHLGTVVVDAVCGGGGMSKMTKQVKAMQAALTALKSIDAAMPFPVAKFAIHHLEEALAEALAEQPAQQQEYASFAEWAHDYVQDNLHKLKPAQQEPVAVHQFRKRGCSDWYDGHPDHTDGGGLYEARTLYTSPPAQRTWVGLTQEEIDLVWDSVPETQFWWRHYGQAIEAKLRSKKEDRN